MRTIQQTVRRYGDDELVDAEDLGCTSLGMDSEQIQEMFAGFYESTLSACRETLDCRAMYEGFAIAANNGETITLEGGQELSCRLLAEMLANADELVVYIATVHGYEELSKQPDLDMFETMLYNAWGAGYTMCVNHVVKDEIAAAAHDAGRFAGRGWTPGENGIDMKLAKTMAELLDFSQIGVELVGAGGLRPIMTVSGFVGVSDDASIEGLGLDLEDSM